MQLNFRPLPKIELYDLDFVKKVINESKKFYIVDCNDFNNTYNGKSESNDLNVKYEDWYATRISYHLNYYNVSDLVICETELKQYVITAQLFLLLTDNGMQAKITLENIK
jgi:hypothetical protein